MEKPIELKNFEPIALAYYEAKYNLENEIHQDWDFHVLYLKNIKDNYVYVNCLDLNIMAYAKTESEAELRLMEMIYGQIANYATERRLRYLMDNPVSETLIAYHHQLKRSYYKAQGTLTDNYKKRTKDFDIEEEREVSQSIKTRRILVEKKVQWRLDDVA